MAEARRNVRAYCAVGDLRGCSSAVAMIPATRQMIDGRLYSLNREVAQPIRTVTTHANGVVDGQRAYAVG